MPIRLELDPLEPRELPAAFQSLPVLPFGDIAVLDHARAIVARGLELGRRSDYVLKFGDSNSSRINWPAPTFLGPLGTSTYNPITSGLTARYPQLQDTWNAFRWTANSFDHEGPGAYPGWTSANVLHAATGEIAATNAGIAFIMVGTNDFLTRVPIAQSRSNLSQIVTTLLTSGVLPVLSTVPDSQYSGGRYQARASRMNQVIADLAEGFKIPLWNAWRALHVLPNRGLLADGTHLTISPNGGGSFWPVDLLYGQNVRNLEALQILDWYRETLSQFTPLLPTEAQWGPLADSSIIYAVGRDAGFSSAVDVHDAQSGELVNRFLAFGPTFGGGVRVATSDVNGDGYTDIVCATASGAGVVKAISGLDGSALMRVTPFGDAFRGGLTVATGDLDGDGIAEVVVGRAGNGSGVRVYAGRSFTLATAFRAFDKFDAEGVSVAVANSEGPGPVIAVAAMGTNPVYCLFDSAGVRLSGAFAMNGRGFGITLAAVDLDGDGFDELAVALSAASSRVRILDPQSGHLLASFIGGAVVDPAFGLRLGTLRSPGDGTDTLLVGNAPGSSVVVSAYSDLTGVAAFLPPDNDKRTFGIFVG